ncbi:MAG: helix-turn-helix domain-containing protein [Lachnospiraceae bacterium]|nr:helix-turn-helix domain-containing protein [Lachnospiraceae bacterium]
MLCNKYIGYFLNYIEIFILNGDFMQISANKQQKELKEHGSFNFPVLVSKEVLADYERGSFMWHWHPEIELTLITDGQISYQVNDRVYELKAGDGLFCNSNALHTGHMIDGKNCLYTSITFNPKIIYGFKGSVIYNDYVLPITENISLGSVVFKSSASWQQTILENMKNIENLYFNGQDTYEFRIQQLLSDIWLSLYNNTKSDIQNHTLRSGGKDIERLRQILSYMEEHYHEKITLDDISDSIGLCREECCRFFKKQMNQSLFDYLMYLRIEKSLPLLMENRLSITEIAESTGFGSSSYYARVFKEQMNCSPTQYKKK